MRSVQIEIDMRRGDKAWTRRVQTSAAKFDTWVIEGRKWKDGVDLKDVGSLLFELG